jgi:hypothetical protein
LIPLNATNRSIQRGQCHIIPRLTSLGFFDFGPEGNVFQKENNTRRASATS